MKGLIQNFSKKALKAKGLMAVAGATVLGATNSFGATTGVTYNASTNTFDGSIDMTPFYSGVTIAIAVVGTVIAVTLVFKALNKAK